MGLFRKGPSLWKRLTDGMALRELWSQLRSETSSTYGLYSRKMESETFQPMPRWPQFARIAAAIFWELSAPRRVCLILGLLLLVGGRQLGTQGLGALLVLLVLGLELTDRMTMKRDLEIAREIQAWLVPKTPPPVTGTDIAFITLPANTVSGDYYDAFLRPAPPGQPATERLLLVVADVAGKGVPAALLMATFHASLRTLAINPTPLEELVSNVNRYTCAHSLGGLRFTTAFLGEWDRTTGMLRYINAGHNYPVLVHSGGTIERLETGGLPLGINDEAPYQSGESLLGIGDRLIIFTDGVVEAQNAKEEEYGEARLLELLKSPLEEGSTELLERLMASLDSFVGTSARYDDITLLILRILPGA
ncbi:MAG: PP2C family protein-serine/threonine phosphatase [Deltaproteobacteria bacterium]|nr:MAG: PP2C family protein-serine/threonine phosphatase [Deltaproteobacteria bacterium]